MFQSELGPTSAFATSSPADVWTGEPIPAEFLFSASFHKVQDDLVLQDGEGSRLVVPDYFSAEGFDLHADNGGLLRSDTIENLVLGGVNNQIAQAGAPAGEVPIGEIVILEGAANVQRAGSVLQLDVGDAVFQNDVLLTAPGASIGIGFIDGTVFNLTENSRIVLDELVYDPDQSDNSLLFTVLEGTFTFFAGQVARTNVMEVDTPVATIGIRGTTPTIVCDPAGCVFGIVPDPQTLQVGSYILSSLDGTQIFGTVDTVGEKTRIDAGTGEVLVVPNTADEQAQDDLFQEIIDSVYQNAQAIGIELQSFETQAPLSPGENDGGPNNNPGADGDGNAPLPAPLPAPGQGPGGPPLQNGTQGLIQPLNDEGQSGRSGSGNPGGTNSDGVGGSENEGTTSDRDDQAGLDELIIIPDDGSIDDDTSPGSGGDPIIVATNFTNDDFFMFVPSQELLISSSGSLNLLDNDASNIALSVIGMEFFTILGGSVEISDDGTLSYFNENDEPLLLDVFEYTAQHSSGFDEATVYVEVFPFFDDESFDEFVVLDNGANTLQLTGTTDLVSAFGGDDLILGGDGADGISGGSGNDQLFGELGDDDIAGGAGDDLIDGGTGFDLAVYLDATSGVTVDLNLQGFEQSVGGGLGTDTLFNFEGLHGSIFDDTLIGDSGDNELLGYAGNDEITGGDGNDILFGDAGSDTLTGGEGLDTIIGGTGDDIIVGGLDYDLLEGEEGADIFGFVGDRDGTFDEIIDYDFFDGDQIDISELLLDYFDGEAPPAGFDLTEVVILQDTGQDAELWVSDTDGTFTMEAVLNDVATGDIISIIYGDTEFQNVTVQSGL